MLQMPDSINLSVVSGKNEEEEKNQQAEASFESMTNEQKIAFLTEKVKQLREDNERLEKEKEKAKSMAATHDENIDKVRPTVRKQRDEFERMMKLLTEDRDKQRALTDAAHKELKAVKSDIRVRRWWCGILNAETQRIEEKISSVVWSLGGKEGQVAMAYRVRNELIALRHVDWQRLIVRAICVSLRTTGIRRNLLDMVTVDAMRVSVRRD
ncbi:hypothetical protein PFISCL1PPCAC_21266 [Pristionchus fissidentatus]|uniref:Uncharacterized protein n=1 Tax=Pristionchus fissidentatus TaxID=1538716 RepID=A0AAV5WGU7_9BILA|nr:hypothetical protein PFISCL1PPCAC_21266 [Pristionchus fissidentatus]